VDIINKIPVARFRDVDDLLAFISIYDDEKRTSAYLRLLRENRELVRGKVCVEAGCGLGVFSAEMARLGARKVYAVEQNTILVELVKIRLSKYPNIDVIHSAIEDFVPPEKVDFLLHEFYGQMLFDESLHKLASLKCKPEIVMPDSGTLYCGVLDSTDYLDKFVTKDVLASLGGVLVSGLFAETGNEFQFPAITWHASEPSPPGHIADIRDRRGDLLAFGLQVNHRGRPICRAGECDNWSLVWTPRTGDRFEISFTPDEIGEEVTFRWI
jgi:SAM-dependent methyltransferase